MKKFIKNRISNLIQQSGKSGFKFTPDRAFYEKIEIKQKRWGLILRNEQPATTEELFKISEFFGFEYKDLLDTE